MLYFFIAGDFTFVAEFAEFCWEPVRLDIVTKMFCNLKSFWLFDLPELWILSTFECNPCMKWIVVCWTWFPIMKLQWNSNRWVFNCFFVISKTTCCCSAWCTPDFKDLVKLCESVSYFWNGVDGCWWHFVFPRGSLLVSPFAIPHCRCCASKIPKWDGFANGCLDEWQWEVGPFSCLLLGPYLAAHSWLNFDTTGSAFAWSCLAGLHFLLDQTKKLFFVSSLFVGELPGWYVKLQTTHNLRVFQRVFIV